MWLLITAIAYFFTALANLIDKILLNRFIDRPAVYAFFIGSLNILIVLFIPFGFALPAWPILLLALITGTFFILGLYFLFSAFRLGEASKIVPLVGGMSPIFVFLFSWLLIGLAPHGKETLAFVALILGIYFIARDSFRKSNHTAHDLSFSFLAAISFAIYYTLSKFIYLNELFINGFVSIAFGIFISSLFILLVPKDRAGILKSLKQSKSPSSLLFFAGQGSGAAGSILTSYAISLANVALVNAMQGLQFVFIFAMAIFLAKKYPHLLEEKLTRKVIIEKIIAIIFIGAGLLILVIG
jgi:drug/metabolite transporter (DMT)-like permease